MPINLLSAGGGTTTLTPASSASNFTVTIPASTGTLLTADSFTGSNVSSSANGYQKLPSGIIIQWGVTSSLGVNSSGSITFPTAFPTACYSVTTASAAGAGSLQTMNVPSMSTSSFSYGLYGSGVFRWIAIGA